MSMVTPDRTSETGENEAPSGDLPVRVSELEKSLADARDELRLEGAVERVRRLAMAMGSTDDLATVLFALFDEYMGMGVGAMRVGLTFIDESGRLEPWIAAAGADGGRTLHKGFFSRDDIEEGRIVHDAWREQSWFCILERPKFIEFIRGVYGHTFDRVLETVGTSEQYLFGAMHRYGMLHAVAPEPVEEGSPAGRALRRFASAFELAWGRYRDLAEVEARAWEARVEAALERVRAHTMSMRRSDELGEASRIFDEQLRRLGFDTRFSYLWLPDRGAGHHEFWVTWIDESGHATATRTTYDLDPSDPAVSKCLVEWDSGVPVWCTPVTPEEYDDYFGAWDAIIRDPVTGRPRISPEDFPDGLAYVDAYMEHGSFGLVLPRVTTDEENRILARFALEFARTYTRFVELGRLEAREREARIEASMERVRARAMAMVEPEELDDVVNLMRDEFGRLGLEELETASLFLREAEGAARCWFCIARPEGRVSGDILVEFDRTRVSRDIGSFLDGSDPSVSIPMTGDARREWIEYCYTLSPAFDGFYGAEIPDRTYHLRRFSMGAIAAATPADLSDESWDVLRRGASVFELAYSRFQDLQRAREDLRLLREEKALTERTLAELRATQAQLVEQEKLASLGALTAGIAHEIKNPLNFVNNFAEVNAELADELAAAIADGDTDETDTILSDLRENAVQIAKHGRRADAIVRAMMQHARGGRSEMEQVDVNAFLDEYATLAWHGMRARDGSFQTDVVRDFAAEAGTIQAMPQELGRVVLNLLNNAFDALRGVEAPRVTLRSRRNETGVEITVADNGPGIPLEIRERIFEPFFTTKPTGAGTGLGLSLSYDIVTKGHGGTMTVGTGPEGGAEFMLTIPAA